MIYAAESKFDQKNRIIIPMNVFKAAGFAVNKNCRVEFDSVQGCIYLRQGETVRENAGYKIFLTLKIGQTEYVAGRSGNGFVTWVYTLESGYFWGHYFATEEQALADLYKRAGDECAAREGRIRDYLGRLENDEN